MWPANQDDGVAKVTLYDAQGAVTSQMTSATTALGTLVSEAQATSAASCRPARPGARRGGHTLTETQTLADGSQRVATRTVDRWANVLQQNDRFRCAGRRAGHGAAGRTT